MGKEPATHLYMPLAQDKFSLQRALPHVRERNGPYFTSTLVAENFRKFLNTNNGLDIILH